MLLSERLLISTFCLGSAMCSSLGAAVNCPAGIDVTESAAAVAPWNSGSAKQLRKFERISVYNGNVGEKEFDLAPDDQKQEGNRITQTWRLKAYRTMNIFLRCRYHDTPVVLYANVPPEISACTLHFFRDGKGGIIGNSDMNCR